MKQEAAAVEYEELIRSDDQQLWKMIMSSSEADTFAAQGRFKVYPLSRRMSGSLVFLSLRGQEGDYLLIRHPAGARNTLFDEFSGFLREKDGSRLLICLQNGENATALRHAFPFTSPSCIGRSRSSFGVGDRLGIASPGHIPLFQDGTVVPVLAQQSLRELDLMGRTYRNVIDAATWAVFNTGYEGDWAADGDHLKDVDSVISALKQGCTMITADLSDYLSFKFMDTDIQTVSKEYSKLDSVLRDSIEARYRGTIKLSSSTELFYEEQLLQRIALSYNRALDHAVKLYQACWTVKKEFDFEISIDETILPTSPEAHYFVAMELQERGVAFSSLAPRFIGEFQKGIDYIGNTDEFASSFQRHAAIAGDLGYKISIHSSSDKFSVYPIIGRLVQGAYHLKTSGTNWLVALETLSRVDPTFFRNIFRRAYEVFSTARNYYHITPDPEIATDISTLSDGELPDVFRNTTDRQVLHVSYGELFKDTDLKDLFFTRLRHSIKEYWSALEAHIGRHLELLRR